MNILIIAAHPDDEVLGMGGTIAKHTSKKDNVSIVYLATGITSRNKNNSKKIKENNLKDIKKLQNDKIPLTVCPLSNIKLNVFNRLENHNLKKMLNEKLMVMVIMLVIDLGIHLEII